MSQIRYHANCLHFSAYFSAVMNGGIKFIVPYRWLLCVSHSQVWVISTWKSLESMHNIICITKRVQHQKVCNPCILLSHRQSASWNDLTCNTAGCLWVDLNIHIKRDERERERKTYFFCFHLLNFRFSEVKNISKDLNQEQLVSQLTLGASPGGHS